MASFTSQTPHFFKIILHHTLSEGKLHLPKKFVRDNGDSLLGNKAVIKLPTGEKWEVELKKDHDKVWFGRGWSEFMNFFFLKLGYFLHFRCEGNCSFHVVISDLSATEIKYPMGNILAREAKQDVEMATGYHEDFRVGGRSSGAVKTENIQNGRMKPPPRTASRRATAFKSTIQNPSFMCKIWPSHLYPGKCLTIPKSFAKMHVKKLTDIVLQVSNGRTWSARCCVGRSPTLKTQLFAGWGRFAVDNKLQVGDFCVFEMTRKYSRRICFKVSIFRSC